MAPRYSVIVSTRDSQGTAADWHRRLQSHRVQVIIIDNPGRCGISQAYNEGLAMAQGDFCCFIHDDAYVRTPGWLDRLAHAVVADALDLVGIAGTTRMPRTGGWWDAGPGCGRGKVTHITEDGRLVPTDYGPPDDPFRSISEVVSLDGVLLFGRTRDFESDPFDNDLFTGFHFYDSDLCLRWLLWRSRRLGVLHGLDFVHRSGASLNGWQPMLSRFHYRHGGFLPLGASEVRVWEDNLSALRHQDSHAAQRLTFGRRPGRILSFLMGTDGVPIAKAEAGDLLFQDELPADYAKAPRWVVLQGAGSGEVIDRLLHDDERPVIVIEPESHLVCWLLTRFNWAQAIYDSRLRFWTPSLDQAPLVEIALHEVIGSLQQMERDLGPACWIKGASYSWNEAFHRDSAAASGLSAETACRIVNWPQGHSQQPVTVVSPRCRIFDDLAGCLNKLGCPTKRLEVPDHPSDWTKTRYWHLLRQLRHEPSDVVIFRNRAGLEAADPRQKIGIEPHISGRVVSWWWDEPNVASILDWRNPANRRPSLSFARSFLPHLPAGSRWLPPAARMEFTNAPVDFTDKHRDIPISFVGQSRYGLLRENLNALANILAHHCGRTGYRIAEEINSAADMISLHRALERLQPDVSVAIESTRSAFTAMGVYLDYLYRMCTTAAFRLAAIQTIAGFRPLVFGDEGWVRSGACPPPCYGGLLEPAQLNSIYRRTKLNVNLNFMQVGSTVNPRVLDIAAAGGAVLTDARPELADLFPNAAHRPLQFDTIESLPDTLALHLAKDLSELRDATCRHVRARHTMLHRASWLAREFSLPTRFPAPIAYAEEIPS